MERIVRLNNDYFDKYNNTDKDLIQEEFDILEDDNLTSENVSMTQRPRRRPNRPDGPDMPEGPGRPSPSGFPGWPGGPSFNIQHPRMLPPTVTPQLPRGVVIPIQGTPEFNTQFSNINRLNNMAYQFRYCLNHFTYIWFWNGKSFWFYPTFVSRRAAEGFIWINQGWSYERINLNHIFFFKCF